MGVEVEQPAGTIPARNETADQPSRPSSNGIHYYLGMYYHHMYQVKKISTTTSPSQDSPQPSNQPAAVGAPSVVEKPPLDSIGAKRDSASSVDSASFLRVSPQSAQRPSLSGPSAGGELVDTSRRRAATPDPFPSQRTFPFRPSPTRMLDAMNELIPPEYLLSVCPSIPSSARPGQRRRRRRAHRHRSNGAVSSQAGQHTGTALAAVTNAPACRDGMSPSGAGQDAAESALAASQAKLVALVEASSSMCPGP